MLTSHLNDPPPPHHTHTPTLCMIAIFPYSLLLLPAVERSGPSHLRAISLPLTAQGENIFSAQSALETREREDGREGGRDRGGGMLHHTDNAHLGVSSWI